MGGTCVVREELSVSADIFLAAVFYARYGLSSLNLFFVLSCLYYAVLQRPAYEDIFIGPHANPQTLLAFAAGKSLLGSSFYGLFFQRANKYEQIKIILPDAAPAPWTKAGWTIGGTLLGTAIAGLILVYVESPPWMGELFTAAKWLAGLGLTAFLGALARKVLG